MTRWLKIIFFALIIGFAKAHSFVKLVILAGLGLAGLWMVHTLAQDFNNIQSHNEDNFKSYHSSHNEHTGPDFGNSFKLFKRSISEPRNSANLINWELILSRDPASCVRSFLCQLAATEDKILTKEEKLMLKLVKNTVREDNWSSKQLQEALINGERAVKPSECMKIYKYCPYSSQTMLFLIKFFER